jgi:outer membrane protein assembly factor BamD
VIRTDSTSRAFVMLGLFAMLLFSGCATIPELGDVTAEDLYAIGSDAAERGDYLVAIEAFQRITMESPLNEVADDALLGLADAHRAMRDYASAEAEFVSLVDDYPRSPLVPAAEFRLGIAYQEQSLPPALDQDMTRTAIEQFERFLATYPGSEFVVDAEARILELRSKLAQKEYMNAVLYFKLKDPHAARIYLEAVATDYPDTPWARRALLDEARSFAAEGATARAMTTYDRLLELYPGTKEAEAATQERASL